MTEIDEGTLNRIAIDMKDRGFSKQIRLIDSDADQIMVRLKKLPGIAGVTYVADGANLFVDTRIWTSETKGWRRFIEAHDDDQKCTPRDFGLSKDAD